MKHLLSSVTLCFICFCLVIPQTLLRSKFQKAPNEISHLVAVQRAAAFVNLLNLPAQSALTTQVQMGRKPGEKTKRMWRVIGKLYAVYVESISGEVFLFSFHKRKEDQLKNRNRTGQVRFPNQNDARAHLQSIARTIGIPYDATVRSFTYKLVNTNDHNRAEHFGAVFVKSDKIVGTISCDIQDGMPTSITLAIVE